MASRFTRLLAHLGYHSALLGLTVILCLAVSTGNILATDSGRLAGQRLQPLALKTGDTPAAIEPGGPTARRITLVVRTEPPGADVIVNNVKRGNANADLPMSIPWAERGAFTVRLELKGSMTWEYRVPKELLQGSSRVYILRHLAPDLGPTYCEVPLPRAEQIKLATTGQLKRERLEALNRCLVEEKAWREAASVTQQICELPDSSTDWYVSLSYYWLESREHARCKEAAMMAIRKKKKLSACNYLKAYQYILDCSMELVQSRPGQSAASTNGDLQSVMAEFEARVDYTRQSHPSADDKVCIAASEKFIKDWKAAYPME